MLVRDGVVAREQDRLASADQIAARVAYVGYGRAIISQSARYDCGCHGSAAAWACRVGCIQHASIRRLHEARKECGMRLARR
jgi:hypothetical protein